MPAISGLRGFSLAARQESDAVSCDASGVFVGAVPLLQPPHAGNPWWSVRPVAEINKELTVRYRVPIDIARKRGALALIAAAFNRDDLAMAAIATVQMQFPDPPPLAKGVAVDETVEAGETLLHRLSALHRSGLLKEWDPAKHPRTGTPPNPGRFAPMGDAPVRVAMEPGADPDTQPGHEDDRHPSPFGGLTVGDPDELRPTLPFPGGLPLLAPPSQSPAKVPPATVAPAPWVLPDPPFPFMEEQPPQLAPYKDGNPTSGIFRAEDLMFELESGYDGPASAMPRGSPGFDPYTLAHVEGHAAALMWQYELPEATLEINNPEICSSCLRNLPSMLPPDSILHVKLPDGKVIDFIGAPP